MGNDELTIEILKQIRDEGKRTNERLDTTNERLDRVVQEQIRHATAIVSLEKSLGEEIRRVGDRIDNVLTGQLGQVVRVTAARVDALEARMARVETVEGR